MLADLLIGAKPYRVPDVKGWTSTRLAILDACDLRTGATWEDVLRIPDARRHISALIQLGLLESGVTIRPGAAICSPRARQAARLGGRSRMVTHASMDTTAAAAREWVWALRRYRTTTTGRAILARWYAEERAA